MATLRNAWQGIGNIGNPATTIAAEANIAKQLADTRQAGNTNIAGLFTGLGKSDAARIAAEAQQQFNTGNPLIDNRARQEYGAEQVGIHSQQQLSDLFSKQLTDDQDTVQSEANMFAKVDTMNDSKTITGQLGATDFNQIGMGDAFNNYRDNLANDVAQQPYEDAILRQVDTQGFNYNPDNSIAAMRDLNLDPSKPESYTSAVKDAALNKSALRIKDLYAQQGGDMPLILAKKVAAKLFAKSPDAVKFQQGTKFESGQTIASKAADTVRNALVDATGLDPADRATYKIKLDAVNGVLRHMKTHPKLSKEDRANFDQQIGTALEGMNIIPGSGDQGRFGESQSIFNSIFSNKEIKDKNNKVIGMATAAEQIRQQLKGPNGVSLSVQARYKDIIRKRLKDPKTGFPQLPDRIINGYIDKLVQSDSTLGPAFTLGKNVAADRTELNERNRLNAKEIRLSDNAISQRITRSGDGPAVAINDSIEKLKKDGVFDSSKDSLADQAKFREQFEGAYDRARNSFRLNDPKIPGKRIDLLDDEGLAAFNMAFYKMTNERVRIQKDTGLPIVGRFGTNFRADVDIAGSGDDILKRDARDLMRNIMKSVPTTTSERMKTNVRRLEKAIENKAKYEAQGLVSDNDATQSSVPWWLKLDKAVFEK